MNKTRLIWGIICLVLAGALSVLNLTLPPEDLQFTIGDANMPWVPAIVLGIVGIVLLASSGNVEEPEAITAAAPAHVALNKRLESIGWGFFLIMLGGFALVPNDLIPKGVWSIGVGLIMLGLNAARYFNGIRMSGFTTVVGILSLLGGIAELLGYSELDGSLLLIILGVYLLAKPYFEKKQLFGKAEEGRV